MCESFCCTGQSLSLLARSLKLFSQKIEETSIKLNLGPLEIYYSAVTVNMIK